MTRHWDDASAVKSVGFDRATHTLRVQLGSGEVYEFADVPERLYDDFAHAPDRDTYFRQHVCDEFSATRVGDIDLAELANERREDAILGAPLAEHVSIAMSDERERADEPHARGSRHTWLIDVLDEDSVAVEIDGRQITPLPRWLLPIDARDGDVLRVVHERSGTRSTISIEVDR
jgi:KTSC domain-containing protein